MPASPEDHARTILQNLTWQTRGKPIGHMLCDREQSLKNKILSPEAHCAACVNQQLTSLSGVVRDEKTSNFLF